MDTMKSLQVSTVLILGLAATQAVAQPAFTPTGDMALEPPEQKPITITLEEAVNRALEQNPKILSGQMSIEAAIAARKEARSSFLPTLSTEMSVLYYNEKPSYGSLGGGGETIDPSFCSAMDEPDEIGLCNGMTGLLGGLGDIGSAFESEQYSISISVQVTQPLTPLYQVYHGYHLAELGVDVAELELEATRIDLAMQTIEAYYGYLSTVAALEAIDESIEVLEAMHQTSKSMFEAEFATESDVLQSEVRLAQMVGTRIEAEKLSIIAREGLLMVMNEPPGTLVVPQGDEGLDGAYIESAGIPGAEDAMDLAMEKRPELAQLAVAVEQAETAVKLAKGGYIPTVVAFGSYSHQEGSSMQQPEFAVGASLSWTFWDWGKVYYDVDEAKARMIAAEAAYESVERAVQLEVTSALLDVKVAEKQIPIYEKAVKSAKLQLELEKKRYDQQMTTSTEVLDANSRLVQAQVDLSTTRYEHLLALASLRKAVGAL